MVKISKIDKNDLIGHLGEISPVFAASRSADEQRFWERTDIDGRHWIYDGPDKDFCIYFPHNNPIEQAWKYVNNDAEIKQVLLRWCSEPYCVRPGHTYLGTMDDWIASQHRFVKKHDENMETAVLIWFIYKQGVPYRYIAALLGTKIKFVREVIKDHIFEGAETAAHQELIDIQYEIDWYNRQKLGTTLSLSKKRIKKRAINKANYEKYKEYYIEKGKRWREENRERERESAQKYRDLHREEIRAYHRQYWRDKRSAKTRKKLEDLGEKR